MATKFTSEHKIFIISEQSDWIEQQRSGGEGDAAGRTAQRGD